MDRSALSGWPEGNFSNKHFGTATVILEDQLELEHLFHGAKAGDLGQLLRLAAESGHRVVVEALLQQRASPDSAA